MCGFSPIKNTQHVKFSNKEVPDEKYRIKKWKEKKKFKLINDLLLMQFDELSWFFGGRGILYII